MKFLARNRTEWVVVEELSHGNQGFVHMIRSASKPNFTAILKTYRQS